MLVGIIGSFGWFWGPTVKKFLASIWRLVELGGDFDFLYSIPSSGWIQVFLGTVWTQWPLILTVMSVGFVLREGLLLRQERLRQLRVADDDARLSRHETDPAPSRSSERSSKPIQPRQASEDSVPRISVEWRETPQPDELCIRLLNRENHPVEHCQTEVIDLAYWDENRGSFCRDSQPKSVYITGDAKVDPYVLDTRKITLVKHEGTKFRLHSGRLPCKEVSRATPGVWQVVLQVAHNQGQWAVEPSALFFSWLPSRKPPLRIEDDPTQTGMTTQHRLDAILDEEFTERRRRFITAINDAVASAGQSGNRFSPYLADKLERMGTEELRSRADLLSASLRNLQAERNEATAQWSCDRLADEGAQISQTVNNVGMRRVPRDEDFLRPKLGQLLNRLRAEFGP